MGNPAVRARTGRDSSWQAGVAAAERGRWDEAERAFLRVLRTEPRAPDVRLALSRARLHLGRLEAAAGDARRALELQPSVPGGLQLAACLGRLHRHAEAAEALLPLAGRLPPSAELLSALGGALLLADRPQEALQPLIRANTMRIDDALSHYRLGLVLKRLGAEAQAAICFRTALAVDRERAVAPLVLPLLVHSAQQSCDWSELDNDAAALLALVERGGVADAGQISPFTLLPLASTRAQQRRAGELALAHPLRGARPVLPPPGRRREGRVRVGYLSNDFHDHATAALIVGLLEHHDRDRFEVFVYDHGPGGDGALRRRVLAACEHLVDVGTMDDAAAARRMRADGLDIGVDLKGHTKGSRLAVFAHRPAPVQLSFLGYPASTGADFLDYLLGDTVVTPLAHAADYSECIAQMPHSYQPNDDRRVLPPAPPRAALGLPEDATVLCCFNQSYKITPELVSLWARILGELPDAVLWLLAWNPDGQRRLQAELQARGVAPERVVFAPRLPVDQHLARLRCADLFLDTWPCNAHTTASEALWAAVPVLTVPGETFASRVAASLVAACGLPELACADAEAYVRAAVALGRDRVRLQALRRHLDEGRTRLPLFDTARYTRDYEALLLRMHQRRLQGLAPAALAAA